MSSFPQLIASTIPIQTFYSPINNLIKFFKTKFLPLLHLINNLINKFLSNSYLYLILLTILSIFSHQTRTYHILQQSAPQFSSKFFRIPLPVISDNINNLYLPKINSTFSLAKSSLHIAQNTHLHNKQACTESPGRP